MLSFENGEPTPCSKMRKSFFILDIRDSLPPYSDYLAKLRLCHCGAIPQSLEAAGNFGFVTRSHGVGSPAAILRFPSHTGSNASKWSSVTKQRISVVLGYTEATAPFSGLRSTNYSVTRPKLDLRQKCSPKGVEVHRPSNDPKCIIRHVFAS